MFKKKDELISFDEILKNDFYRTHKDSHRKQLTEESKVFMNTLLSKFLFVATKDTLVELLTTSKTMDEVNHYKSMIATLETIKKRIENISQNII